ncbi:hypothetical protein HK098_005855 [Nowakowskiella sp. JEL0407]|nr:hypothetical protein HK098_005855 [Nowakowskiella sp. JEL0407]
MTTTHSFGAFVTNITELKSFPQASTAYDMLLSVISKVSPLLKSHSWSMTTLAEFYPTNKNLLGININHGHTIKLRLRHPHDKSSFLPLDDVIQTMLHELIHIERGPHDETFYKLLDALAAEYDKLVSSGFTGIGFQSDGYRVGSFNPWADSNNNATVTYKDKAKILEAVEERKKRAKIMDPPGGRVLGLESELTKLQKVLTPREMVALALDRRLKDKVWCGGNEEGNHSSDDFNDEVIDLTNDTEGSPSSSNWSCTFCTFINKPLALTCEICLNIRASNDPLAGNTPKNPNNRPKPKAKPKSSSSSTPLVKYGSKGTILLQNEWHCAKCYTTNDIQFFMCSKSITRIVVQPPEAFHVLKGLKVGYGGIKDAAATYYHFDGTGPEFHLYSRPEKSVGFILQKSSNSKTVVYDKVIVEVQEDPLEFANLVCATVLEKIGFQVIIATPKTEKVPLAETDARAF